MLETFSCVIYSLYKLLNLTHTNIVSVYHYIECSIGNYAYAPRLSCYSFPRENINPHFYRMRFPLENIYQYVIASNLFVNRDLFDVLCIIIAIIGHKCEL